MFIGSIMHALAYVANYLYLILIGRIVTGFGLTSFMYSKRYCSDARIVGIRRRTTLASWLVIGQGFGFSAGPFLGGVLYKIGFGNAVFNGFTSPGWLMAGVWAIFYFASTFLFTDVERPSPARNDIPLESPSTSSSVAPPNEEEHHSPSRSQWGVVVCMCWYAMTCFFVLGAWEANIPVYAAVRFNYSPYASGNFIALGGITTFPFLILNVLYARRFQDRTVLTLGSLLGLCGLIIMAVTLGTDSVDFASLYICWFLVALGFNIASACTYTLLSKQLPPSWNGKMSMAIQYSNYTGRVLGAVWGGAGVKVGMLAYIGVQIAIVGIGESMRLTLWKKLKAKTG
ncbi:hypothetical protein HGRIS_010658 [Hohenbuehelia grisea]|uniref:MFS general substrate transporter n=1 Tax=Hohenbuehelia grisea TaxID=104357 RepID=A0ABR3IXL1_9AGAR